MSGARQPWFQHWGEAVGSRKLRALSDREERFYWWFCCVHALGRLEGNDDAGVAWELRPIDVGEVTLMRDRLSEVGLLEDEEGRPDRLGHPHDFGEWNKRREVAGASTERVRRFRERQRNDDETPEKRNGNGDGTAPRQGKAVQGKAVHPSSSEDAEPEEKSPRLDAAARRERAAVQEQGYAAWIDRLEERACDDGAPQTLAGRYAAACENGLEEFYSTHTGRFSPAKRASFALAMDLHPVSVQLFALETYADLYYGKKDERYLIGIVRRLKEMTTQELDAAIEEHRRRQPQGLYADTVAATR